MAARASRAATERTMSLLARLALAAAALPALVLRWIERRRRRRASEAGRAARRLMASGAAGTMPAGTDLARLLALRDIAIVAREWQRRCGGDDRVFQRIGRPDELRTMLADLEARPGDRRGPTAG